MIKDPIDGSDPIEIGDGCIDGVDRTLNPLGRFHRHAGTIPMVFDEFGRCAYCVKNGQWNQDA